MRILTLNCGSSSLKADLFQDGRRIARVLVTAIGEAPAAAIETAGREAPIPAGDAGDYASATRLAVAAFRERGLLEGLTAAGHRVVHGGASLTRTALIDEQLRRRIESASELAPLHNNAALQAIEACRVALPSTPMFAAFDTAFFQDLPPLAAAYALPRDLAARLGIRRYGFHGLAHQYMATRFADLTGLADARIVTLQLGSGCSAAAIRGRRPIDTSMGFTPLEGLVMSTRSGDLDAAIPLFIAEREGLRPQAVEEVLNEKSGLLGLSGVSGDVRRLVELEGEGHAAAKFAIELFCYRIRKYIGAYAAALGGIDGLVFGGGVGENSPPVRQRVCAELEWMGLSLEGSRNREARGVEAVISSPESHVRCIVTPVDEAAIIAAETAALIAGNGG